MVYYRMLLLLLFSFLWVPFILADEVKDAAIQELIVVSDMITHISEELGPFEHFTDDRDNIKEDMIKEGMSDGVIEASLNAMDAFYQDLQRAKGPILAKITDDMAEYLSENFTLGEIRELLGFFQSPTMRKFKVLSLKKMPKLMKILQKEKVDHLKEPFERMKRSLELIKRKKD